MSGLYTRLAAGVLFPLHERLKRHDSVARLRALESSQWWPRERIEALRVKRLRDFLRLAARDVPYYCDAFLERGLDPGRLSSVGDLAAYPLLTKPIVRAQVERLKSIRAGELKRYNTGGSSGEPLIFFIGNDRVSHDVAAKWRATRWFGVDVGDRELVVWGSPVELGAQDHIRLLRDCLLRTELLPAFDMSPASLDRYVARIRSFRPAMLFGYPSSLSMIAAHAHRCGVRLDDVGIKVAFVTSERLFDHQREQIEQVYGCPVANGYGGRDAGFLAHQCPAGGMHITAEDIVLEVVDEEGRPLPAGQRGEIVVTHLATGDFPFIRYRTGDIGVLDDGHCACGRGLPLLREIEGRTTDFVYAGDGTPMHALALIYVLRDVPGIAQFKVVQEALDDVRVFVVPDAAWCDAMAERVRQGLRQRLGATVKVGIEVVTAISPERSGKFRYVVSRVSAPIGPSAREAQHA